MKEINEYILTRGILVEISDNPNFSDEMRNNASSLACYIKSYKPEPLIVKSGNTWVANWEGVDYLCVNPKAWKGVAKDIEKDILKEHIKHRKGVWKSFTGPNPDITELTDEIAGTLRPIVKHTCGDGLCFERLIYVKESSILEFKYYTLSNVFKKCELAIAKDLQELMEEEA